jgi:hypothetical protein
MDESPHKIRVGANMRSVNAGATLVIAPKLIMLEPGKLARWGARTIVGELAVVVHTKPIVTVIRGRLLPPWMNTSVVIEGDSETAVATVPGWRRHRLLRAIRDAGFTIEEQMRLFDVGGGRVKYPRSP